MAVGLNLIQPETLDAINYFAEKSVNDMDNTLAYTKSLEKEIQQKINIDKVLLISVISLTVISLFSQYYFLLIGSGLLFIARIRLDQKIRKGLDLLDSLHQLLNAQLRGGQAIERCYKLFEPNR